jgi:RimJ/RimL family protein N-acetyltransferase
MRDFIFFRPLARTDFQLLLRWLNEPHVTAWWHEPLNLEQIEAKYGPRIDGTEPTHVFLIECEQRPIGWIQWYRWADYPQHARQLGAEPTSAGLDLAIGESEMIGKEIGPGAIQKFAAKIFADPEISGILTDPEENNERSLRAFQKAGFQVIGDVRLNGEEFRRNVVFLPRPGITHSSSAQGGRA